MSSLQSRNSEVGSPSQRYSKIVVAYDGSEHSKRALMRAAAIAKQDSASLMVVNAVDTTMITLAPMSPPIPAEVFEDIIKSGEDLESQALNLVKPVVSGATGVSEEGNAAEIILKQAAENGADLIVIGRRGISEVKRFLIGGVSSAVVAHSHCDVLVVK